MKSFTRSLEVKYNQNPYASLDPRFGIYEIVDSTIKSKDGSGIDGKLSLTEKLYKLYLKESCAAEIEMIGNVKKDFTLLK